jgi:hypothetical protein
MPGLLNSAKDPPIVSTDAPARGGERVAA